MTRYSKIMALVAGGALALAGTGYAAQATSSNPAAAQTAKAANKAMTSVTRGKIKSISDTQVVVERRLKTGIQDMTFAMNASTQKQGDLKVGQRVVIHYRKDNNQDLATLVRVPKSAKSQ